MNEMPGRGRKREEMKGPLKGLKVRPTVSLGQVLPQVSRDLALDQKVRDFALVGLWDQVVGEIKNGEAYRKKTRAVKLTRRREATVLLVKVRDAATAGELSFLLEGIREKLNGYAPQTGRVVDVIDLKIGSL